MVHRCARHACVLVFSALVAVGLSLPAVDPVVLRAQPPRGQEIYQDFRGSKPLKEEWKMIGLDREAVITPEAEGLRITLAKKPKSTQPVGVRLMFPVSGDFEITGTYQLLSADRPLSPGGSGVGVAFNLVAQNDHKKFVRFGRFLNPPDGNTYVAECRLKDSPKDYQMKVVPTKATSGQLRLIREGSKLRYLVADDPPDVFREVHKGEFTDEDLEIVRLGVNNNGSPATVDARIVDIRIRLGNVGANPGAGGASPPADQESRPASRGWLAVTLLIGFAITLVFVAVALFLVVRHRRQAASANTVDADEKPSSVSIACPGCGKNLKVKPESAAKKVRCPECGKVISVPASAPPKK